MDFGSLHHRARGAAHQPLRRAGGDGRHHPHPERDHTLSTLAAVAGVSARHLSRLFLHETGHSPQHFVDRSRLEAACAMLTGGSATLDQVAERSGVGSTETLRRLFHRELGITPSAYRHRFRTAMHVASSPPRHGAVEVH